MDRKNGSRAGFRERMRERYGTGRLSEMIVLRGNGEISVRGCLGVLQYSPAEVRLSMKSKDLILTGKRLVCVSFSNRTVSLKGQIEELRFVKKESST